MEAELSWNLRVRNCSLQLTCLDMFTLTKESHEVMLELIVLKMFPIDAVVVDP